MGKDLDGGCHDLLSGTVPLFTQRDWGVWHKICQDSK